MAGTCAPRFYGSTPPVPWHPISEYPPPDQQTCGQPLCVPPPWEAGLETYYPFWLLAVKWNFSTAPGTEIFYTKIFIVTSTIYHGIDFRSLLFSQAGPLDEVSNIFNDSDDTDNTSMEGPRRKKDIVMNDQGERRCLLERDSTQQPQPTIDPFHPIQRRLIQPATLQRKTMIQLVTHIILKPPHQGLCQSPINNIAFDEVFKTFNIPPEEQSNRTYY